MITYKGGWVIFCYEWKQIYCPHGFFNNIAFYIYTHKTSICLWYDHSIKIISILFISAIAGTCIYYFKTCNVIHSLRERIPRLESMSSHNWVNKVPIALFRDGVYMWWLYYRVCFKECLSSIEKTRYLGLTWFYYNEAFVVVIVLYIVFATKVTTTLD